ncbi:MAG: ASKHA domain-containing protein [Zestosphaera sp.]
MELLEVVSGKTVLELLRDRDVNIRSDCGGLGLCGKCVIKILTGTASQHSLNEEKALGTRMLSEGFRLACQARVLSNSVVVEIPESSTVISYRSVDEGLEKPVTLAPPVLKRFINIAPPSLEDQRSDLRRLLGGSGQEVLKIPLTLLKSLPKTLRECRWEVTVTTRDDELLDVECGDAESSLYGLAVDVGTSRVVTHLLDLRTGETLAVLSSPNPQQVFGSDVMSRITHAVRDVEYLEKLRRDIIALINELMIGASSKAGVKPQNVYEVVVVGNTVMTHLLLGVDPSSLGAAPYVPVFSQGLELRSEEVGIRSNPNGYVYVAPGISGFIGGDAVAGALAVGLDECKEPCVLIDVGSNTEVIVNNGREFYAASAPAGPAFEGFSTKHGMKAVEGAVSKVFIYLSSSSADYEVSYEVIGGGKPLGICGSAYIDALAHLHAYGVIDERGRFRDVSTRRLRRDEELRFVIVWGSESSTGKELAVYSKDIDALLLAKAAVAAVTHLILKKAGLTPEDVRKVFVAGSFGTSLNPENAAAIGLLPHAWVDKTVFAGNTAISGAKLILKSTEARKKAEEVSSKTRYVEVSADKEFTKIYVRNLSLPNRKTLTQNPL